MRIAITLVIEMTDKQVADYAGEYGLPRDGGRLMAKEVVEDVNEYVLGAVSQSPAFYNGGADITIKH